jgi:hypothetical protein
MMISMQGTDIANGAGTFSKEDGGIIKSYNNKFVGNYEYRPYSSTNTVEFDAYEVSSRDEIVPNTVKSKQGGNVYSNFDTSSSMYKYNVETPEQAMNTVKEFAGRVNGGDIKFAFKESDDTSYTANSELMSLLKNYVSNLVLDKNESDDKEDDQTGNVPEKPVENEKFADGKSHNFSTSLTDELGIFRNTGVKYNSRSATVTVDGVTYKSGLKMESSTELTFETKEAATIKLIVTARSGTATTIKVDDVEYTIEAGAGVGYILTINVDSGTHTIKRGNNESALYAISVN